MLLFLSFLPTPRHIHTRARAKENHYSHVAFINTFYRQEVLNVHRFTNICAYTYLENKFKQLVYYYCLVQICIQYFTVLIHYFTVLRLTGRFPLFWKHYITDVKSFCIAFNGFMLLIYHRNCRFIFPWNCC